MALDSSRVSQMVPRIHDAWSTIFNIAIGFTLIWQQMGSSALGGMAVCSLLAPTTFYMTKAIQRLSKVPPLSSLSPLSLCV